LGNAKARGTYQDRKAAAIAAGRVKPERPVRETGFFSVERAIEATMQRRRKPAPRVRTEPYTTAQGEVVK
jgi:hypothetical protein